MRHSPHLEYQVVAADPDQAIALKGMLNQYGAQGWELVALYLDRHSAQLWPVFKRRTNG